MKAKRPTPRRSSAGRTKPRRPVPAGRGVGAAAPTTAVGAPSGPALDALLALSHDLAGARAEPELCAAVVRALDALFPGRSAGVRLVDPETLALTTFRARGRLRAQGRDRLVLRRDTVKEAGLSEAALLASGAALSDHDEPLFDGSGAVAVAPLAVAGALHGLVNVEYEPGSPGGPEEDAPLLLQLANQAALAVRNVRSMEELASLKGYLEDLIEHANALIAVVSRDGEVTVWNGALTRLTGTARADAVGRDLTSFVPPEDAPALVALLERTLGGEAVDGHELRLLRAGGGEARVAFNTAPIHGAAGEVGGVVAIGQDLTRIRNLEAAAEQSEKMAGLGRLAAGIVHELNNPLTAVTMYADSLYEKWASSGAASADIEKLKAIRDAGNRIQKLTRDLMVYARPSSGKPEPLDLAPLLDQAARMCKPALKEASGQVERNFETVPQVDGNRPALTQVFVNLIANAAQAMPSGGTVRLGLAPAGDQVVVTVADDGAGMGTEVRDRAFEPFFTTRTGKGIGLGLATVKQIVERHGGSVSIESALGRGTTVTVALPARAGASPA